MTPFGKKLAFIAMLMAILCIVPVTAYNYFLSGSNPPEFLATLMVVGTPAFAVLSLVGLLIWAIGEIRSAEKEHQ